MYGEVIRNRGITRRSTRDTDGNRVRAYLYITRNSTL